jgi:photosynthetic reaction center cytochrome c subunit
MKFKTGMLIAALAVVGIGLALTFQRPPAAMVQRGFRGTGMDQVVNRNELALKQYANQLPAPEPPADLTGVPSSQVYSNVQVLGDIDAAELTRFMTAMTSWVAPKQGCNYCHVSENLADDTLYTKVVARRMIQMVRHINADWKPHVGATGVTCYTCHRGQPVPAYIWFDSPGPPQAQGALGNRAGVSAPTLSPGLSSLPYDPFSPFLDEANNIRVISTTPLPGTDHQSIKQTEWTYALMMHFSEALGVNCTFCHNTRSFAAWDQSTPQRGTAWYGIRMVRDLNEHVLDPLKALLPPQRWGALGDGPKVNCTTCHQGVYKPLFGASMLKDYQELATLASASPPADAEPMPPAAPKP